MKMKDLCSALMALVLGCLIASNTIVSKNERATDSSYRLAVKQLSGSEDQSNDILLTKEIKEIRKTLTDYIEGSTGGQPKRLQKAFHPGLNLYSARNGELQIWSGKDYISSTKEGQPTGETGKILAIDFENDIAVAKVEIMPPKGSKFIDYFMLIKIKSKWTIVHKMFTRANGIGGTWQLDKPNSNHKED